MTKEELVDAFTEYAAADPDDAMKLICGLFVGLGEAYVEMRGGDSTKQIDFETGDGQRAITIHAVGKRVI